MEKKNTIIKLKKKQNLTDTKNIFNTAEILFKNYLKNQIKKLKKIFK
jgi:hypothetical protein